MKRWYKVKNKLPPIGKSVILVDKRKNCYFLYRKTELEWIIRRFPSCSMDLYYDDFLGGKWIYEEVWNEMV